MLTPLAAFAFMDHPLEFVEWQLQPLQLDLGNGNRLSALRAELANKALVDEKPEIFLHEVW